jgi:hypothetical protein
MTTQRDKTLDSLLIGSLTVEAAIRISLLGLFLYWSLKVIGPFLTIALWSAILTVALYPLFDWLAARLGSRRLAATLITSLCLVIVIGPVTWLGFGLIGSVDFIIRGFDSNIFSIPSPADSVKNWPLIGEQVYRLWTQAATDIKTILLDVLPKLKPLGSKLLEISGTVVFGLLEFVAAIIISGFLYSPGPRLADSLGAVLRRIFGPRSEEMLKLAGSTIRNVSRGVVGIALVQSFLAGLGFLAAGIPAAGLPELHRPGLGDHSDRAGNSVRTDHRVELDRNGDVERPHVYRLHGPGRPGGQRPQAPRHGPRTDHPDAGNLDRRRRRYIGVRNQRPVSRSDRALGHLGAFGGLGAGRPPRRESSRGRRVLHTRTEQLDKTSSRHFSIAVARSCVRSTRTD